jgi:RNA polymerase sigma-70 factor (ECF subfamily)
MSTFFSAQSDAAAVSDLRAWSENQLIAAAKGGRRAPFGELYERHMKRVTYVTRRITRNREDAEDAVQDCFLSAFVHLKDFEGRSRFATWLTRIAINAALKDADVSRQSDRASNTRAAECRKVRSAEHQVD